MLSSLCSIEDAKQKAEHDKMMKIADEKKKDVRRQIAKLRRQFKSILEQNEGLPVHLQLRKEVPKNYMFMDRNNALPIRSVILC